MTTTKRILRWTLFLVAPVLLVQALLAGLALSGVGVALAAHMALGVVTLLLAFIQSAAALTLWLRTRAPGWVAAANLAFVAAVGVQMAAGRAHLLIVHLPLGVALFGAAVALSVSLRIPKETAARLRARSAMPAELSVQDELRA